MVIITKAIKYWS